MVRSPAASVLVPSMKSSLLAFVLSSSLATAAVVGLACAAATLALALSGRALVGGTVHLIAEASQGSQVVLTPLGRLVGEPDFGPVSAAILGTGEGLLFGAGLAFGLTRRPK